MRLVLREGRHILLQASNNEELIDWLSIINYAGAFNSAGIRVRPLAMAGQDIELTGILGAGKTQISGTPGQVTLNSAKTGLIKAATAEELLQRATGWQAPISHLVDWVQARPATQSAQIQKDSSQRISQIIEQGWMVDLSYNQQATVPNRLILKQSLENGGENRITMVIQNR